MSWDQDYSVPSVESLLEDLTLKDSYKLLEEELERQGIKIVKAEDVVLDDGFYAEVKGVKVTLSDGRVFIPKLTEKFCENGNHGIDVYEYFLEGETPEVVYVNGDTTDPDVDVFDLPEGYGGVDEQPDWTDGTAEPEYGLTDEADLASDGELESENSGC